MRSVISTIKCRDEGELFKTLSEELPVGVCIMQEGKFCYVNRTFPIAIGYTVEELVGKDSLEPVVAEDREIVKENTVKMLRGELRSPYQFRVTCKDGRIVWVMATVKPIQYHGKPAILGNYMEITERKQIEEALKENEERYRELADSITDVFFAMDKNLRYTYWNRASEVLTGIRAGDALGRSLEEVFPDRPWRRRAEDMYRRVLKTQQLQTFVNDYDTDGRHHILEINAYPSRNGISVFVKDITEHKRVEDLRRQAEEEKSALLEEAPVSIVHTDLRGRITYVNQRFESESGYARSGVIGKNGFQLDWFPAGTLKFLAKRMTARLTGSPARHWETQFKRKDGRWIWVELEGKILRRSGLPVGFQIIATNITERKQAEEALRQSEERYRTILEEVGDGYFETDLAGNCTFVNDGQTRLLGYSKEEIIGTNFRAFTPQERVKGVLEAYNRMYKTGEPLRNFVDEVIRKDGSHGFAETSAFPIRNDRNEIVGFRGVRRDITARKQMEEALRHSEEKYRTILEQMEDSYFEVDLGGHLTFVNDSTCRNLGYSREEIMGKSYKAFTVEDDIESVFRVFNEVYRTGVPNKGFPWMTVRKDGTHGFAETSISVLKNDKGETIGFRGVGRDITERKQTEERLRQSEENYRTLFNSSVIGMYVLDLETMKVVMANPAAREMAGFGSAEPGVGVDPLDFVIPEDREQVRAMAAEELEQDLRRPHEVRVLTKDGGIGWISISAARIMHKDRLAALVSFTDITERKRMEEALRQSKERYRALFDSSVTGTLVVDAETMKVMIGNQAAVKMFGFSSAEDGIGAKILDFVPAEEKERAVHLIKRELFERDSRRTFDLQAVTKHGRRLWISATGARITHGDRLAALLSFTDITERKLAEERLRQSEENYRILFDNSVIGTIVLDAETVRVMMTNQAAAKMLGFSSADEVKGADVTEFIHPEDRERVLEFAAKNLVDQNSHQTHNIRAMTKDGREIWISVTGARIMHEGKSAGLISFADITEQKLQNERLMMTDRLASLGELASGAAHELNNPLTSIIGFSQLLVDREVPDDIREDLKLINSEAQRAASVTRNLLTFAGKHGPVKEPSQINNIIDDVLRLRVYEHKANGIEVEKRFAPDLPEVMVDYFQTQQVFMNIIINAEYFMVSAHNKGNLTITTKQQDDTVVVEFTDDGPGISPENLRRIFDPFFTTKEAGKGTGLGLSICHGIVTEHGGQIYATSQLGKGATIVVQLPTSDRQRY